MSFETGDDINFSLPAHWKWCQLDELKYAEKGAIISGPFGSNISSKFFVSEGIPVIRGNNLSLSFDRFIDDGFVFLTQEKAKELKTWAKCEDIIFTAAGTIGQVGIIGKNTKYPNYIISNKQIRVRLDTKKIIPLFAYYWLASSTMVQYIQQRNTGSTIPLINLSIVKGLPIPLPPLNEQEKIVNILSALDEKIELNRQTNATLEAIAQAIFKEWFVDFNFPGATGEMVESELGMIPKGWRAGKLGDVCELAYGKGLKSENRIKGDYPVIGSNGIVDTHNEFLVEGPGIVIGRKGTIGEVIWTQQNFYPIDTTFYIKDLLGVSNLYFHYFLLKEQDFKKIGSDSAVPGLNRNQAYGNLVIIPSVDVVKLFNCLMQTMFDSSFTHTQQSVTLVTIRDALLPKLMNGEIVL